MAHDPDMSEFLVVHFGATAVTEEGVDVMCRRRRMPQEQLQSVLADVRSREPAIAALLDKRQLLPTKSAGEGQAA